MASRRLSRMPRVVASLAEPPQLGRQLVDDNPNRHLRHHHSHFFNLSGSLGEMLSLSGTLLFVGKIYVETIDSLWSLSLDCHHHSAN